MKHLFAFIFCAAILFAACQKEPSLTLSGSTSLEMNADGSSATVSFTVNRDWTASASESWVTVSPSSGSASDGPVTVTVKASPNTTYEDRSATVTIKAEGLTQTVTVRQPANLGVVLPTKSYEIASDARTIEVEVQSNVAYTVTVSDTWITQTGTKGLKSEKLTFSVSANDSYDARNATITVTPQSGGETAQVISVRQAQKDALLVGTAAYSMPYGGGEIEVKVESNVQFEVKSEVDWIQYLDTKALNTSTVRLKVSENTTKSDREGKVEIKQKGGSLTKTITVNQAGNEEAKIKAALMKIYDAMNGPQWTITKKWDVSQPLENWEGVRWNKGAGELELYFDEFGLKGAFPDCFADLASLKTFFVKNEPGVSGTLPSSFNKLKNLDLLVLSFTSMTSLSDVFKDIPLVSVMISGNTLMTGPLPETLGGSSKLADLDVEGNAFTGTVPDSWARLGTGLVVIEEFMDEWVPDSFVASADADYLVNMYLMSSSYRETPVVVGDYDITAYWPRRDIKDIVTGTAIPYKQIVSKNKATVLLNWATWCPFSAELMPFLKRMYEKYHGAGLEIIAAFNADSESEDSGKPLKDVLLERGYEKWYNFNLWNFSANEWMMWCSGTPSAIVVDNQGIIMTSSRTNVNDPARNRFGYTASTNLIPLLEGIFGPLDEDDTYSSKDYSKDGEVLTLQKASKGNGINIVFMGDAYTDKDMGAGGLYETMMKESMEEFFAIEPYKTFRDRFNVYAVKVVSKNGRTGDGYSTALGTVASFSSISTGNEDKCYEYALKVPGIKDDKNLLIGVLVNSVSSRGICSMSESRQSGVAFYGSTGNAPDAFGLTIRHEAGGHGFAFLDDEYSTHQGAATEEHIENRNTLYKKYGWFANVDFTNDPKKVKWSTFLSDTRYKDEVGIYEGGSLYQKGAFRPSENSVMNAYGDFNAPSRWAIYQRIMKLSGEECTFENFLQYDAVNRSAATKAGVQPPFKRPDDWQPGAPPVIVP